MHAPAQTTSAGMQFDGVLTGPVEMRTTADGHTHVVHVEIATAEGRRITGLVPVEPGEARTLKAERWANGINAAAKRGRVAVRITGPLDGLRLVASQATLELLQEDNTHTLQPTPGAAALAA